MVEPELAIIISDVGCADWPTRSDNSAYTWCKYVYVYALTEFD